MSRERRPKVLTAVAPAVLAALTGPSLVTPAGWLIAVLIGSLAVMTGAAGYAVEKRRKT